MRILVVDLSHVFWTIALGGQLKNPIAARDIAINQVRSLASDYDRIAIAVDGKTRSFRANHWPGYKAKRSERPAEMWSLLEDTVRHCEANAWHVFRAPGLHDGGSYEADDVAATVVAWAREHRHSVDILSGDSDLTQLVDDELGVRVLRRFKGELKTLDVEGVKAWCKVPPILVAEVKALAGDAGDGYGDLFPGIGPVKAIAQIEKYGSALAAVEAAIAAQDAGSQDATTKALAAGGTERALLGYHLSRVVQNVPIDVDSLTRELDPVVLEELGAELVDDNAPASGPTSDPSDGGPMMPRETAASSSTIVADPTMRMLAPAQESFNRLIEFRAFIKRCLMYNVDYGKIPNVAKNCLFKPGAEKLIEIYGLAPTFEIEKAIEDWDAPLFYYRVRCRIVRKRDGMLVSECVGSCNSRETKYSGRWAKENQVPPHLDLARLKRREFVAKEGQDRGQTIVQYRMPNEEIFDQVNTLIKMAQKRAMVGAAITATRSGGVFTQDAEDIPAEAYGAAYSEKQWDQ